MNTKHTPMRETQDLAASYRAERNEIEAECIKVREVNRALVAALTYARRMMKPDADFAFVDAALALVK